MDYKVVSQQVVDNVGGLENIEGATHCVTRLRLVLKDTSKYNKAELENIDGVKGVLYNSGQLMIIFGTGTVNRVYDEFMALTGVKEISASEVKGAEGQWSWGSPTPEAVSSTRPLARYSAQLRTTSTSHARVTTPRRATTP